MLTTCWWVSWWSRSRKEALRAEFNLQLIIWLSREDWRRQICWKNSAKTKQSPKSKTVLFSNLRSPYWMTQTSMRSWKRNWKKRLPHANPNWTPNSTTSSRHWPQQARQKRSKNRRNEVKIVKIVKECPSKFGRDITCSYCNKIVQLSTSFDSRRSLIPVMFSVRSLAIFSAFCRTSPKFALLSQMKHRMWLL